MPGPAHYSPKFTQVNPKSDNVSFILRQSERISTFKNEEASQLKINNIQRQAEHSCCNRIINYLSKQSREDQLIIPTSPLGRGSKSALEELSNGEPAKKYTEKHFTPNDSLYTRTLQKVQNDAKDKDKSPYSPKNLHASQL